MTLARPDASITTDAGGSIASSIGSGALSLSEAGVMGLDVRLDVGRGHDRLELRLSHLSPLADTEPGSSITIALIGADDAVDVVVVDVMRVDDRPGGIDLMGLAPSHRLGNLWISRTYVQQSVADVVSDLLAEAEVDGDIIDGAGALELFHVDGRRNAWDVIHDLALLSGAEVTTGVDGSVSFTPAPGVESGGLGGALAGAAAAGTALGLGAADGIRRGANLIDWALGPRRPETAATIGIAPLGAASSVGTAGAHHLLKNPEADANQRLVAPSIRTADGATTATSAITAAAGRQRTGGHVTIMGDPSQRAGTDVTIDDHTWHVTSVRHRLSARSGFTTTLELEGTA